MITDIAASLNGLALLYRRQGKYPEAEKQNQKALKIREETLSPDHPDVATGLTSQARIYSDLGRYKEAEKLYDRPKRLLAEKALGPNRPDVATSRLTT